MVKIKPEDLKCPTCHDLLAPHNPDNPTVMIETCGEFIHQECFEGYVISKFQDFVLGFFSNTKGSFTEFQSTTGRYLTLQRFFTMEEVVYNHNIDAIWEEFKPAEGESGEYDFQKKEVEILDSSSCSKSFSPQKVRRVVKDMRPKNLTVEKIRSGYASERRQVYGTEEWGMRQRMQFSARLVYHACVAFLFEVSLQTGLWIHKNLLDGSGGKEYTEDVRQANVSERLTPFFIEYWGIKVKPELKKTTEMRAWEWIRNSRGFRSRGSSLLTVSAIILASLALRWVWKRGFRPKKPPAMDLTRRNRY